MPTRPRLSTDDGPDAGAAFFDDAYYRLLEPFHTEAEARYETAALRELLALAQSDAVLDLGCGWGRHLGLLAGAGHDVVGLDVSLPLLRRARAYGVDPPLVVGDMLDLPLADRAFDVVLNLATSLGLFIEDGPATRALAEARRVLRPGGRLLLEGMQREDVAATFAARDEWTLDDGTRVRARRRFDARCGVSHEVLRWDGPTDSGTKRHSLRIRTADEIQELLMSAGLEVLERWGDWTGEPFGSGSPRLIVSAGPG